MTCQILFSGEDKNHISKCILPENRDFGISCKLSPVRTICMKYQVPLSDLK